MKNNPRLRIKGLIWLLALPLSSQAQDIIVRTNGVHLEAQVLEVRGTQVFYKPWAEPNGPTTVLGSDFVHYIQYRNGQRINFEHAAPPAQLPPGEAPNLGRNVVAIRSEDLIFGNITLAYERLSEESRVGLKVPLSLGMGHSQADYNHRTSLYQFNKIFSTGLELNLYMTGPDRARYFVGPAIQWGSFRYLYYNYDPTRQQLTVTSRVAQHYGLVVNGGVWYQLGRRLVFSADAGIGLQSNVFEDNSRNYFPGISNENQLLLTGNLNLGYQF